MKTPKEIYEQTMDRVMEDLEVLHRNCDPADMTFEDHRVWEVWNRVFYPERYNEDD